MWIIGESIQIISPKVRRAIEEKDEAFIKELARRQVEAGAGGLELNIGPRKKDGPEVMSWLVNIVQEEVSTRLSLDTSNVLAMESGLRLCRQKPLINSTDVTEERLSAFMPLAARYQADIIALTFGGKALPTTADERVNLALEYILVAAERHGVPVESIYLDPLVLTVCGNQEQALPVIETVRMFKQIADPPPKTICGLSNISNGAPKEIRPLINRVYLLMLLGAGLDAAIMDALDPEIMEAVRIVESRDNSTLKGKLYLAIYEAYVRGEPVDISPADFQEPELIDIVKTLRMLEGKVLYAHSYLRV